MNAQKLSVKLFLKDPAQLEGLKLVPVFQSWIQMRAVEDHLLIDVADYDHVPDGPGTVLVAHEANFSMDRAGGRPGLMYQRKQPLAGTPQERIAGVFHFALRAAARLEAHPGLEFKSDEMLFRIADRLLAPNTAETFAQVKPALEAFLKTLSDGAGFSLEHRPSPATLFEVTIRSELKRSARELAERMERTPAA